MNQPNQQDAVWSQHARQWGHVGAPLRPTEEDGRAMMSLVGPALQNTTGIANVVVMGVTPEVVQLPWPGTVNVHAFDHSAEMIKSVWSPHPEVPSAVQQVCWKSMPNGESSVAVVVGDGSFNALPRLAEYPLVFAEVSRVLRLNGLLCARFFVRPDRREQLDAVAAACRSGAIRSFHALKWRVAMALSEAPEYSVAVDDIRTAFNELFPDREKLQQATGWKPETVGTIDAYKGALTRYTFPTMGAIAEVCAPWFELADQKCGSYELADRCPTVLFKPVKPATRGSGST